MRLQLEQSVRAAARGQSISWHLISIEMPFALSTGTVASNKIDQLANRKQKGNDYHLELLSPRASTLMMLCVLCWNVEKPTKKGH